MSLTYKGKIYYASKKAQADKLLKEGRSATIRSYYSAHMIANNFVEINFDSSGKSYIHMQLA